MRQKLDTWRAGATIIALGAALCGLTGCADQSPPSAASTDSPLKSVMKFGGFATDAPKMSGFVVKTRPPANSQSYIPLQAPRPQPASSLLTPAEVKAETARLNAARKAQQRKAGTKGTADDGS